MMNVNRQCVNRQCVNRQCVNGESRMMNCEFVIPFIQIVVQNRHLKNHFINN